jgi:hypothetical protein
MLVFIPIFELVILSEAKDLLLRSHPRARSHLSTQSINRPSYRQTPPLHTDNACIPSGNNSRAANDTAP